MFETEAQFWDDVVKRGLTVPHQKKGAKCNPDNCRGVCLLSIVSRNLTRYLKSRLTEWSEKHTAHKTIWMGSVETDPQQMQRK